MDKTKVLNTNGSLMKVKSIAECSKSIFLLSGRLRQVLLCILPHVHGQQVLLKVTSKLWNCQEET